MTIQQAFREAVKVIEKNREEKRMNKETSTPTTLPREEWLAKRRECIGASEAAAVCGMGNHEDGTPVAWMPTALEVYLDKIGELPTQKMNVSMKMGLALEPMLAELYTEATGHKVVMPPQLQRHPDTPWIGANPDRYTQEGNRNVQLKTTARRTDDWGNPGTDEIPTYYICQVQAEMYVTGLHVTDLAVLFLMSKEFAVYTIEYNEEFIKEMVAIETDFWQNNVLKRIPPEPDYKHPSTLNLIKKMYPGITDGMILEVPPENMEEITKTIAMLDVAEQHEKTAKTEIDQHKTFLLGMMGDAPIMHVGNRYTMTRKMVERGEYTVKASSYVDFRIKDNDKKKGKSA